MAASVNPPPPPSRNNNNNNNNNNEVEGSSSSSSGNNGNGNANGASKNDMDMDKALVVVGGVGLGPATATATAAAAAAAATATTTTTTQAALLHNPGLSVEWTSDEQSLLEELLHKFASERNIVRYAKVAMQLKDKTIRDVALRCRWLTKKENGKRRKEDYNSARKNKDKKEKVVDLMAKSAFHALNHSNGPPYAQPVISMDGDDGISYKAIGGVTGQLLEQNAQALDQITANFVSFKIHENFNLFCQAQNNILTILNDFNDMPEIMKQMPPLPVNLNEELANSIFHWSSLQKNS